MFRSWGAHWVAFVRLFRRRVFLVLRRLFQSFVYNFGNIQRIIESIFGQYQIRKLGHNDAGNIMRAKPQKNPNSLLRMSQLIPMDDFSWLTMIPDNAGGSVQDLDKGCPQRSRLPPNEVLSND
ncbi:hypothetical protein LINPERHAP1_LOCUS7013 [Linum perenne]